MSIIILRTEITHFIAKFNANVQKLFLSSTFQTVSNSIVSIFISAFIWRVTDSLVPVALFALGQFVLQPLIFIVNGLLLRRLSIRKTFFVGAVASGIMGISVVFFVGILNPLVFLFCGLLKACGDGLYWPNRNYLEFQEVTDEKRNYYFGLMHSVTWLANTLVPFVAGWFIVFGVYTNWYSQKSAYWALFALSFFLMLLSAYLILGGDYESPTIKRITRFNLQKLLNERALLTFAQGVVDGSIFLIPVIVLIYLGDEGILGTVAALAAIAASIILYFYGRFSKGSHRYRLALIASVSFVLCSIGLIVLPHPLNAFAFVLFAAIAADFFLAGISPILLACSEKEMGNDIGLRYTFIFDNELYLNIGRVCGILIILGFAFLWSQTSALLLGPLCIGLIQLVLLGWVLARRKNYGK